MNQTTTETPIAADAQEPIRAAVRAAMEADKLSLTDVARLSGVPYSTVHAWLDGKYSGNNQRQAEKMQRWLDSKTVRARTRDLLRPAPSFIMTQTAQDLFGVMEYAQHLPDLAVATGGAGVGKTSAAHAYRAQASNVWLLTAEPCLTSPRSLLDALANLLGIGERYSAQSISRAIVTKLYGSGGLVIIDEAQHLPSCALDQLRTIHDKAEIGVALLGNEAIYARLNGGTRSAEFAQLYSRVGVQVKRPAPLMADIRALLEAWGIAGATERKLLTTIAKKPGALRGLTKCLRLAHMMAGADGEPVSEQIILDAWQRLGNDASVAAPR
jgi:DNA transposition AAA+ family ATPase